MRIFSKDTSALVDHNRNMLIIVSGPDRVGKSTLIKRICDDSKSPVYVSHHSAPPKDQEHIFDFYKDDVLKFKASGAALGVFDRAWPCSFILEQHRRRNFGHMEDLVDFEIWLNDQDLPVVHLAQLRPWHWSAPLHIEELREEGHTTWGLRDELVSRMQEHKVYTEQLLNFYEDVTLFPSVQLTESVTGSNAVELCKQAILNDSR